MLLYLTVAVCLSASVWGVDLPCPVSNPCHCENSENGRIINCRSKSLTAIPQFTASEEIFYELTFSSSSDCPGGSNCNNINTVPSGAFNGLKVRRIDLTKNVLNNIASDAFSGVEAYLEDLLLSGDKNTGFPYAALPSLINLQSLHLANFKQTTIDADNTIKQLQNLQNLTITNTVSLQAISQQAFQNSLPNLRILKLIGNSNLNYFPTGAIRQLVTLNHLSFVQCGLRSVPLDAFAELRQLVELDLSHNLIAALEAGSFNGINGTLQYLNFFLNNLNEIALQPVLSQTWPVLEDLHLGHNKIGNLNENMFRNMPRLMSIKLMYNEIKVISSTSFSGLNLMYHLDLSNNQIETIHDGAFSPMVTLGELFLDNQNGRTALNLTKEAITGLENSLETLKLDSIELVETEIWRLLKGLTNIRELHMSSTGVTDIPNFVFSESPMLMYITLSDTAITDLRQESFYGLKDSLETLDLQFNSLATVSECVFKNFSRLSNLYLDDNPIVCDCRMQWLHEKIVERSKTDQLTMYYLTITCSTPGSLTGQYLGDVDKNNLVCNSDYTAPVCQDFSLTTSTSTTTTTPKATTPPPTSPQTTEKPIPILTIDNSSIRAEADSIYIKWIVNDDDDITGYHLSYQELGVDRSPKTNTLHATVSDYTLTGLNSDSDYLICLYMELERLIMSKYVKCITVSTAYEPKPTAEAPQSSSEIPVIVGSVCGGVALIILVTAILCLLLQYRNSQNDSKAKPVIGHTFNTTEKPKIGYDSKRFYKQKKNKDPEKDIQVTVISNKDIDNTRISAGSYQILNIDNSSDGKNIMRVNQNPESSYENDVSFRQLPRTPHYSSNSRGYQNRGFSNDDPSKHFYNEPSNTYYDMSETEI